jgi:hypothetical protein
MGIGDQVAKRGGLVTNGCRWLPYVTAGDRKWRSDSKALGCAGGATRNTTKKVGNRLETR